MKTKTIKTNKELVQVYVMDGDKNIGNVLIFPNGDVSVLSSEVETAEVTIRHFGNKIMEM